MFNFINSFVIQVGNRFRLLSHKVCGCSNGLSGALQDTVMLTGPESALPQAVDQLHASCSRFQQGCVQQALPLEGYRVAAFTHPDTRARSSQLLEQQAQDVGLRHRVRISLELNQVGGPSNAALHGAEIQVRPCRKKQSL